MTSTTTGGGRTRKPATSPATLHVLRITAMAGVLVLVFQFLTAGQVLAMSPSATALHGAGAIAMHIIFGLTTFAALLHRRARTAVWPVAVVAVAFVLSFFQAHFGSTGAMSIHVPVAVVLTTCIVWVAAWSFTRSARR